MIVPLFFLLLSLSVLHVEPAKKLRLNFQIEQGGTVHEMDGNYNKITLYPSPFMFHFSMPASDSRTGKDYALQVCFVKGKVLGSDFMEGMVINELKWFQPGTGIATEGEYLHYQTGDDGHYYIFYNENTDQRARMVVEGKVPRFTCDVRSLKDENEALWPGNTTMLVVADLNHDGIMQRNEFHKIEITFQ